MIVLPPSERRPDWQVLEDGAADADGVNTTVIEKALVLDRDDGVNQILRDFGEGNFDALLFEDRERRLVAGVEDGRRLDHIAHVAQRLTSGQSPREVPGEPCHRPSGGQQGDGEDDDRRGECTRPPRKGATARAQRSSPGVAGETVEPVLEGVAWLPEQTQDARRITSGGARQNSLIIRRLRPRGQPVSQADVEVWLAMVQEHGLHQDR